MTALRVAENLLPPVTNGTSLGPHASETEYMAFVKKRQRPASWPSARKAFRDFVATYPDFDLWLREDLPNRVGRLRGEGVDTGQLTNIVSYRARPYLVYAALTGRIALPWDYLLAIKICNVWEKADDLGLPLSGHAHSLANDAVAAGWTRGRAWQAIGFCLPRFVLRHGDPAVVHRLTSEMFDVLRGEIEDLYTTVDPSCLMSWVNDERLGREAAASTFACHALHAQLGLVVDGPTRSIRTTSPRKLTPIVPPTIQSAFDAWTQLDEQRGTPLSTRRNHDLNLRYFATFLSEAAPEVTDLAQLNRAHVLDYLHWLKERRSTRPPHTPLTATTRTQALATLSLIMRDLHENELADVPGYSLIHSTDYPKKVRRLPRFIPKADMRKLTAALDTLEDPYQRAAILIARWSGARRDEIRRLELDALDVYADGTFRLRIPAGKTGKERQVPLAAEAGEALQAVTQLRERDRDLGVIDRVTGDRVRYLFMRNGRLLSSQFLFDHALLRVCREAGLVRGDGGQLITPHRFRHTLGTDLAEQGARWRTIMSILGHESASMTMVYAHISDPTVKADYEKVVAAGAHIAGPAAELIRDHTIPQRELDWLKSNFYKSEMELGACTRIPEEGPCECDLFLTCSKFFTTKDHAPRLRRRWHREKELIADATERGWPREVERHTQIQRRLEQLLRDLDEAAPAPDTTLDVQMADD